MFSILGLGFLLGMQHALEADHVAAVASLTSGRSSSRQIMAHGATWGIGHAFTLMAFGGLVLLFDFNINDSVAHWLEFAVGVMLAILGVRVIIAILREKVHIHFHRHSDGRTHIHAHSHKHDAFPHNVSQAHDHGHTRFTITHYKQTFFVGILHGMAGTAALVVLITTTGATSFGQGALYLCLFAVGSILGMVMLTGTIVFPASFAIRNMPNFGLVVRTMIGIATIIIGAQVMVENWV